MQAFHIVTAFFAKSPLLGFPVIALVLFLGVFLVAVRRVYRRAASSYAPIANLPLADDETAAPAREVTHG